MAVNNLVMISFKCSYKDLCRVVSFKWIYLIKESYVLIVDSYDQI